MKKILLLIFIGLGVWALWYFLSPNKNSYTSSPYKNTSTPSTQENDTRSEIEVIAVNLDTPWAMVFLPDRSILVTERAGRVRFIDENGILDTTPVAEIDSVKEIGEGGLLGMALHPDFSKNNFIYFYYTYSQDGNNTLNRVVRMTYGDKKLTDEKIIINNIPGASNHNGGRIKFGPDNYLYVTTGDAQDPSQAQNKTTLGGKILRITDMGAPAPGNPFGNLIFTYGHRNPQGLAWDSNGILWETEHGRSSPTGYDEINLLKAGGNYGWPLIQGNETRKDMEIPIKNSGSDTVWAPAGSTFMGNSLFFGGLRGQTLYEAVIIDTKVTEFNEYYIKEFGRIRDVVLSPDGLLYLTTSNRDGRAIPGKGDDKIIRINKLK